jgi:hypothetical protein
MQAAHRTCCCQPTATCRVVQTWLEYGGHEAVKHATTSAYLLPACEVRETILEYVSSRSVTATGFSENVISGPNDNARSTRLVKRIKIQVRCSIYPWTVVILPFAIFISLNHSPIFSIIDSSITSTGLIDITSKRSDIPLLISINHVFKYR